MLFCVGYFYYLCKTFGLFVFVYGLLFSTLGWPFFLFNRCIWLVFISMCYVRFSVCAISLILSFHSLLLCIISSWLYFLGGMVVGGFSSCSSWLENSKHHWKYRFIAYCPINFTRNTLSCDNNMSFNHHNKYSICV